jgi:nucleotide-binding universal stress UspA family protein
MTTPRHIVVPTDFSDASNAAKIYATMFADTFGAALHVLRVIPDPLAMGWAVEAASRPRLLDRTERSVRERLEQLLSPDDRQKFSAHIAVETRQGRCQEPPVQAP